MKNRFDLGQTEFNALLDLLSDDRHEAGIRYERIRSGLLRYFDFKGCSDPAELADTTFNRVAVKLVAFNKEKTPNIESFIYGFARNIAQEGRRGAARTQPIDGNEVYESVDYQPEPRNVQCLQKCLNGLDPAEKRLILEYHSVPDGKEKSAARQKMFEQLNIAPSAFYTKISRIRLKLRKCIEEDK